MPAELLNTLLILGAAQGLFLAILLTSRQTNAIANRLLAVAMMAFSLFIFQGVYYAREYYLVFPHLIGVSTPLIFVFGPILYLYAQSVSTGGRSFRRMSLLHFVPFALVTLNFTPFYFQDGASKIEYLNALFREGPPLDLAIVENLQYPHGIAYVILTIVLLRRHRVRLKDTQSSIERINLQWLRNLTIGIVVVWTLATGLHLLGIAGLEIGRVESRLTPLAVSIMVYTIGYLGLKQPEIFHPPETVPLFKDGDARIEDIPEPAHPEAPPGSTDDLYRKSGLTQEQAEAHTKLLLSLMEEQQPYKRNLLTLHELAEELSISAHNLSEIINTQLGKNFYDFINGYRVEEVKRRLQDPRSLHLTILAIAEESGFNSKSSFNAFFKKQTGLTPSQYRMRQGMGG